MLWFLLDNVLLRKSTALSEIDAVTQHDGG
jgi:hypothetical protein